MIGGPEHLGDRLSAMLDGEVTPAERGEAEAHLSACAQCRSELEGTAAARQLVRALPVLDPPFGLIERVLLGHTDEGSSVPQRAAVRSRPRRPVWLAGAAAAAALAVLAVAPRHASQVQPPVAHFVDAHATATPGADPISGLAPVAVPVSFSP